MRIVKVISVLLCVVIAGLGPAGAVAQAQVAAHASCPAGARENILGALPGSAADRFAIPLQTTRCLQARGTLPAAGARAGGERLITFDPPGSTFTVPSGINPDGVIVGYSRRGGRSTRVRAHQKWGHHDV